MEYQAIETTGATSATPRFTVSRQSILPILDLMARQVIERRNFTPILANIQIEACPSGELRITGTDLDLELSATLSADIEQPGATTVSAATFRDIVKKAPKGSYISFHANDGRAAINAGRARQSIATLPVGDFPALALKQDFTLSAEFDAVQLADNLARVKPAISTEKTRYYLNGINVTIENGLLCMAATDGHRLSLIKCDHADLVDAGFAGGIIPRKAVGVMLAILKARGDQSVHLDMSASKFVLEAGDIVLKSKLIDGTFPDYRRVIPNASYLTGTLSVQSTELLQHCTAAMGQDGKVKAVKLEIDGGAIQAGISGPDGFARPLSAEYVGDDCGLAFNAPYMADFAKANASLVLQTSVFDSDRIGGAPILIKSPEAPQWTGVLMPVRSGGDLPKPRVVTYADVQPAPGRAADLFGVETGFKGAPRDAARVATPDECKAYLLDYAKRLGLPDLGNNRLCDNGLTVGEIEQERTEYPETWDRRRGTVKDYSQPTKIAARFADGAYSIPMPGCNQSPVTVQYADNAGEYGDAMTCTDAKGRIALPDQPKGRAAPKPRKPRLTKREKVWQEMGEVLAVRRATEMEAETQATPTDEPAPVATLSDEFEPSYRELPNGDYQTSDKDGNIWLHRRDGSQELIHDESGDAMAKAVTNGQMMRDAADAFNAEFMPDMTSDSPYRQRLQKIADEINARNAPQTPQDEAPVTQLPQEPEIASCEPEIALTVEVDAQPDAMAALIARMDALEAMITNATTIEAANVIDPSGAIETFEPLPVDDRALSVAKVRATLSGESKPKRTAAHIRAIMAYLAMRKLRHDLAVSQSETRAAISHINRVEGYIKDARNSADIVDRQMRALSAKRRRAVLKARDMQTRLYAEHKMVDRANEQRMASDIRWRDALLELGHAKEQLKGDACRRATLVTLSSERDAAIAEGERLRKVAYQQAGHIVTVSERLDRAEAILRTQGPSLAIVPPISLAVAA